MYHITCSVEDCDRRAEKRGWCAKHYQRWLSKGHVALDNLTYGMTVEQRYEFYVRRSDDGCWSWAGPIDNKGYAWFGVVSTIQRNGRYAGHRYSFERSNGPIPEDLVIRHTCDNPPCTNPAHLILGTKKQNAEDMVTRGRSNRGSKNGNAIVTAEDVIAIRAAYASGTARGTIATQFGMTYQNVWSITTYQSWKHVA